jgi:hypothetical protein
MPGGDSRELASGGALDSLFPDGAEGYWGRRKAVEILTAECICMNCPGCASSMTAMKLDGHMGVSVAIDLCTPCQAFWFDRYESLKLSPGSILKLMKLIGEDSQSGKGTLSAVLRCPRCGEPLLLTNDLQRTTRFSYWRCNQQHGRFIRFFEFLREKNFIRPLSRQQIEELRRNIQTVGCSNCAAPIDLTKDSACRHCASPISMLDMKQPQQMLEELRKAAETRQPGPELPMELVRARREVEISLDGLDSGPEWWSNASSFGLVQAGLSSIARWLKESH